MDLQTVARARWAVTAVFFVNGSLLASYLARIPSLKLEHQLDDGELGVVLTLFGVAALLSMQFVGGLVSRFGSARMIRLGLVLLPATLIAVGQARGVVQLGIAVLLMGAVHGAVDVAMNAHAVVVERLRERPIMNGCHAAWSTSAVLASLGGAGFTRLGVPTSDHFLYVGLPLLAAGLVVTTWLLPQSADQPADNRERPQVTWRTGWTRPVLVFGVMGFIVMIAEAAVISWSGVFLHEYRDATLAAAALGFTAYTACQTAGRVIGDHLTERFGAPSLFRVSALVAVVGLAVVLVVPSWPTAIGGFAILGLGASVLLPLIYSAVGHTGSADAATSLSRFTTFTYAGVLVGPAVVGWFAEAVGLTWTLAGLLPLLLTVAANSRLMRRSTTPVRE